jgi:non-specific serine/threonine protein kinase
VLGIADRGGADQIGPLVSALGDAPLLLVLDNFEQVLAAGPGVVTLLLGCARLTILVTSRAPLRVSGERERAVLPLVLPDAFASSLTAIAASPAVQLYCERVAAVDPAFSLTAENTNTIAAICHRLDGLPLAIELAAARGKLLPPAHLLPRLARSLPLLSGGPRDVPARLQTMHEAIAWSHDLLTSDEQRVFRRLAVFTGGFTLEAAEQICQTMSGHDPTPPAQAPLEAIASLFDKSLLSRNDAAASGRLGMLETIREFALEQLIAAGEEETTRVAHAAYFSSFDHRLEPNHTAPGERFDDRLWGIEAELPNLRAALAFLVSRGDIERVLRLGGWLSVFWRHRGNLTEGRQILEWALEQHAPEETETYARALAGLSLIVWSQGEMALAASLAESALSIARKIAHAELIALALHMQGLVALVEQRWHDATALMTDALALWQELGLDSDSAMAMRALSSAAYALNDSETSGKWAHESLALFSGSGHPSGMAGTLRLGAMLAHERGDTAAAVASLHEGLRLWTRTDARWTTSARGAIGEAAIFPRWAGIDDRRFLIQALGDLAEIAAEQARYDRAVRLLGATDRRLNGARAVLSPLWRARHMATTNAVRATVGEPAFLAWHAEGRRLHLDEAVALALSVTAPQQQIAEPSPSEPESPPIRLTRRQAAVLRLIIAGRSDKEIAATLFLSRRTVQDHVSHLIAKLGVANRTEAAAVAVRDHLV